VTIDSRDGAEVSLPHASAATPAPRRSPWWLELLTIAWLAWVYDLVNNLAPLRLQVALRHARGILRLERSLGIDPELSLDRWLVGHKTLAVALSDYYDNVHFIATLGLLAYLWWRRADLYRPLRSALVLINVIGFAVFWLYPVAPPRLLDGFTDIVASTDAFGSWHTGPLASEANQLAAMPSLHGAYPMLIAVFFWKGSSNRKRILLAAYPLCMAFSLVYSGEHFVIDIFVGWLYVFITFYFGSKLLDRWEARQLRKQQARDEPAVLQREAVPAAP